MAIQAGEKMPSGTFGIMTESGPGAISTDDLFSGKKVVLVSVPGAFTPTCSMNHLPGYVEHAQGFADKGVDTVACLAVNDVFVMDAWGDERGTAMARLVSIPVSLAVESVLAGEMPAGVSAAPSDPRLVLRYLGEVDRLAQHLKVVDHL